MIDSTHLDNSMSRVKHGVDLVKLLNTQGYSNQVIEKSIHAYLECPTITGERESGIIEIALKYIQQQ